MIKKLISGGQTGADQAALDVAIELGTPHGGSDFTRKMAEKHGKRWMHIDANKHSAEAAVEVIRAWISGNNIEVLNVAGPRASKDPRIYTKTRKILKAALLSGYENG